MLEDVANLLHDKGYYLAVAHAAYYSCFQVMKCIWLYSMGKSEDTLASNTSQATMGSHEYLLNEVVNYINSKKGDTRYLRNNIPQLKKLRRQADYDDTTIDYVTSKRVIDLSQELLIILRKY
jgi:hypothetical protein